MICEKCKAEGKTSRIYGGDFCASTLMGSDDYYDEDGNHHSHDPNSISFEYRCSNAHRWVRVSYIECFCGFNKGKSNTQYMEEARERG